MTEERISELEAKIETMLLDAQEVLGAHWDVRHYCANELENALKHSTHFLDIGIPQTKRIIKKLRGE